MSVNYKSFFLNFFSANFIVRSLSLLKDLMLGWIIGPGKILDVFFFLITIPTVLTSTWNKALETVFVSTLETDKHHAGKEVAINKFSLLVYNFSIVSFLVYIVFSIAIPFLIYYFYPEFVSSKLIYVVFLINVAFVVETYILGIKVLCFTEQRFFLPAILPVFQSVVIILGLLTVNKISLLILSILFAIGAFLQFLFLFRKEFRFLLRSIKLKWDSTNVNAILKGVSKLSFASGLSSLNLIIDQSFALSLGEGANTYIHYGNYFVLIFTFLVVNNISTIFFPQFQKYALSGEQNKLESDTRKVTRIILLMNVFILVFILNHGYFALNLLLGHGKISQYDLQVIFYCAIAYGGSFLGLALNAILVRILHVYNHYNIIVFVAVLNSVLNIVLNFIFSRLFGVWGIALSTSVTLMVLITVYIIYLIRTHRINLFKEKNYMWIGKFGLLAISIGFFEYFYLDYTDSLMNSSLGWNVFVFSAGFILIAGISWGLKLVRFNERRLII